MLAAERRARITAMVRSAQVISTDALVRELEVSGETIRRDLLTLERKGVLTRVHGGATAGPPESNTQEPPFEQRTHIGTAAKSQIGAAAAALVRPGQTIMIDIGTTTLLAARALPHDLEATVITNSLVVATELADRPHLEVLTCGGRVRAGDLALSNSIALEFFGNLYPDVALLGSGGLHPEAGLTDYHLDEAAVRKTVVRNSRLAYALVDSEKFGRVATHHVAGLDELAGFVVDAQPVGELRAALTRAGTEIVIA